MRTFSPFNILYLAVAVVLYLLVSSGVKKRRRNAEAARRGCLPPPTLRSNNLLGTQILKESIKAQEEDRGPQYVRDTMNKIGQDVHTIRVPVLDYELLVTRDPENVKALFQSADFDIAATRSKSWWPLLGQGIFTARGEAWKHSRALVRPQFAREQYANLDREERHAQALLSTFDVGEDGWTGKVDLAPRFYLFTLDTATEFLYGKSANSLSSLTGTVEKGADVMSGAEFGHHLDEAKNYIDKRGALAKFYWLLNSKEFKLHCQKVHGHVDKIVHDVLARGPKQSDSKKFVLLDELAKSSRDPIELRNETLHILTAARDPTGALLGWVFYLLARHPRVVDKLRGVIISHFGSVSAGGVIDFTQLKSCEYLQYCINETLRYAAVIPLNERVAVRDTVLPCGGGPDGTKPIFVPKGNQILIPKFAMQHRADIWGDDVEEFKPERWQGRRAGFEFSPFGGGPRKCIGQQFGQTEAAYLIVRFLQRFEKIENLEPEGPVRFHHAIENRSGTGVQVRLHEARA